MTVMAKAAVAIALSMVSAFAAALLTFSVDERFVWLVFVLPMIFAVWLMTLRCERCGKLVYRNEVQVLGVKFTYWGTFNPLPRRCSRCGFDLARKSDDRG
jgi:ribosomal protein L37E